jgi:dTDP-4-amino-4,6-dideoxygalactose transaminase
MEKNVVGYRISPYGVNLPCGMDMDEDKVGKVCEVLNTVIDNNAK